MMGTHFSRKGLVLSLLGAGFVLAAAWAPAPCAGEELRNRQVLPPGGVLLVEVAQPLELLHHPLVREVWSILQESPAFQQSINSPDLDKFQEVVRTLEASWGVDWRQGFAGLTAGGVALSVKPGPPPQLSLVIAGNDAGLTERYVAALVALARDRLAQSGQPAPPVATHQHHGQSYQQFGPLFYAVAGERLLLTNAEADLRTMLDRLSGREAAPPAGLAAIPAFDAAATGAAVTAALDLRVARLAPQLGQFLPLPSPNPQLIAFAGGWVDLVRRSDYVVAGVTCDEQGLGVRLRFPAGRGEVTPGLSGFFGAEPDARTAPLLQPPEAFYSASWYRDYGSLWKSRTQLINPDLVQKLEQANADVAKTTGAPGFAEIAQMLGPHFRVVACRQLELGYPVSLNEKLPMGAILVDLRDEAAFRTKVMPNIQTFTAIISLTNKIFSKKSRYQEADLYTLHFPDDAKAARTGNRVRYNFGPTFALTRGHFILGSTPSVVRGVIDELDRLGREASAPSAAAAYISERQQLSLARLTGPLQDLQEAFVRQAVLERGLTATEAEHELQVVARMLQALAQLSVTATFGEREFEYQLRLGPSQP